MELWLVCIPIPVDNRIFLALLLHHGATVTNPHGSSLSHLNVTWDGIPVDLDTVGIMEEENIDEREMEKRIAGDATFAAEDVVRVAEALGIPRRKALSWFYQSLKRTLELLEEGEGVREEGRA